MTLQWLVASMALAQDVQDSAEAYDRFGSAVASGDVDCDDVDDLVIAVLSEESDDTPAVHVLYATGLSDSFWLSPEPADTDSEFVWPHVALATGDFDDDGCDDVVLGVPYQELNNLGAIHVLYGSIAGIGDEESFDQNDLVGVSDVGDHFGWALAAGDFDADGYADLAIGVPGEGDPTMDDAGEVAIMYGTASGLSPTGAQSWDQDKPGVEGNRSAYDDFGSALAAGDFDEDGYADLAIGVPGEDISGVTDAGAVNVLYGGSSGLTATGDQVFWQGNAGVSNTSESYDEFGASLAAGDFDNDGEDDLAIGVPGEEVGGDDSAGQVHVLYGNEVSGLGTSRQQVYNQDTSGIGGGGEASDKFGASLAAGDFDGDEYADLAIGVPGEWIGTVEDAGAVNVLYGAASTGLSITGTQLWYEDVSGVVDTSEAYDDFGAALAVGDLDGDGLQDLIVGAPGETVNGQAEAGQVHLFAGAAAGLTSAGDQVWNQDPPLGVFLP
jgi:hypothetical protein